jgi:hypothetical protein
MEAAPAGREEEILMSRKMTSAWEWIAGWLHDVTGLSAVWGEEGSQMDPNG